MLKRSDIEYVAKWQKSASARDSIPPRPQYCCRISLASLRGRPRRHARRTETDGRRPERLPTRLIPVDLVIDHSVQVDQFGSADAFHINAADRVRTQSGALRIPALGAGRISRFPRCAARHRHRAPGESRIPGQRGLHKRKNRLQAYPDTLVGTDSHTTMINGLGVVGWGVGGIEAEACMLGQPVSMLLPEVVGFKLDGKLPEGATATDLVLTVTQMLRKKGVVGKFVEFYGTGCFGALTGRSRHHRQHGAGIWRDDRLLPGRSGHARLSEADEPKPANKSLW